MFYFAKLLIGGALLGVLAGFVGAGAVDLGVATEIQSERAQGYAVGFYVGWAVFVKNWL